MMKFIKVLKVLVFMYILYYSCDLELERWIVNILYINCVKVKILGIFI